MFLTTCTNCGHQRIRKECTFSQSRCQVCGSLAFGLIDYGWIRKDAAEEKAKELNIQIED